jgi:hypothetical protein
MPSKEQKQEELDALVHDAFSKKATNINNEGIAAQIACLEKAGIDASKYKPVKKYNHAVSVSFSVDTDHVAGDVTAEELIQGLVARLRGFSFLGKNPEILEACDVYDTYENELPEED